MPSITVYAYHLTKSHSLDRECFLRLGAGTLRNVGVTAKLATDLGLLANGIPLLYLYHY
jgi:hypothetical protein